MGKEPGKQPPDKSCLQDAAVAAATVRHIEGAMEQEPGNWALKQLFSTVGTPESELESVLESEEELELELELEPELEASEAQLGKTAGRKQTNVDSKKKEIESLSDSSSDSTEKDIDNLDTQQRCYEKGVLDTCEYQTATSNKGTNKGLEAIGKGKDIPEGLGNYNKNKFLS